MTSSLGGALPFPRADRRRPPPVFGPRGLAVGHVAGIEIRIDPSWLLVFALVAWSAAVHFPEVVPGVSVPLALLMGAVASLVLFASVLVHELTHSLTALSLGYGVQGIKLFVFGGVSEIVGEPRSARDEFAIAVVGPLSSAVIAGGLWLARRAIAPLAPAASLLDYLATANLALAVFNMFPGLPLDGGRVLRAAFRAAGSSLVTATRRASLVGRGLGILLMAVGAATFLLAGGLSGLWLAFVGWFLRSSAIASERSLELREQLENLTAGDLARKVVPLGPEETVQEALLGRGLLSSELATYPVALGRHLVGLVATEDLRAVPRERWPIVAIGAFDTRSVRTVSPGTPLLEAVDVLGREGASELAVADEGGRFLGLLRIEDVGRLAAASARRASGQD